MQADLEASTSRPALEGQLIACVEESLGLYLYSNARFICERLVAQFPSEANIHLLATCYFRSNQEYRAYYLMLDKAQSPASKYLLAQCCVRLGKMNEAEHALAVLPGEQVPGGAAGHFLLGRICKMTSRVKEATQHFYNALSMDPLLWCAYEELCNLGAFEKAESLLRLGHQGPVGAQPSSSLTPRAPSNGTSLTALIAPLPPAFMPPGATTRSREAQGNSHQGVGTPFTLPPSSFVTPSPTAPVSSMAAPRRNLGFAAQNASQNPFQNLPSNLGDRQPNTGSPFTFGARPGSHPGMTPGARHKVMDEGKLRKVSGRLFPEAPSSARGGHGRRAGRHGHIGGQPFQTDVEGGGSATVHKPAPAARCLPNGSASQSDAALFEHEGSRGERSTWGEAAALTLLKTLGQGYCLLCQYRCQEAMEAFRQLGEEGPQYRTAWVMKQMGRAFFEMTNYEMAGLAFQSALQRDPHNLEGMEVYSTVLWHLQRLTELSHLAQEAIALDRQSPHAWLIMGNCFSLQKEHENALRFFQRALQLDATFVYAYTLAGHEYFANEDFEKGLQCYRNAVRLDPRHYNAWYGIGQIFFRQEKYEMAEYHFRKALGINERSSVLRCYVGMALAKVGRPDEALAMLARAIEADPHNPLAKFERAALLIAQERLQEALEELKALKEFEPREASVWFQLGKVYKRLSQVDLALQHFSTALDLRPAAADVNLIKSAIEKLRLSEEEEEEEM